VTFPAQTIEPGSLQDCFQRERKALLQERIVERLWNKDARLWSTSPSDHDRIRNILAWLDLPVSLGPHLEQVAKAAASALADGLNCMVFVALGSSSLAANALVPITTIRPGSRFFVLDSTHPSAIRRLESQIDLEHALFVFANKSGEKLEDTALYLYFQQQFARSSVSRPLQHFGSAAESSSYLASLSRSYSFRFSLTDPPGIPAPFCSTLHFGALLTAITTVPPAQVLSAAREMRQDCSPSVPAPDNPALQLAAFLCSAATAGRRFLIFLSTPSLERFSIRFRYLTGGSFTKREPPLIPVAGKTPRYTQPFEDSAAFVVLENAAEDDPELRAKCEAFASAGAPFVRIRISGPSELIAESYKWEIATVLAAARLGFDPFDWPDMRPSRSHAMELLDNLASAPDVLSRTPRLREQDIEMYGESGTRHEISTRSLVEAMHSFFQLLPRDGTLVLLAFLDKTPAVELAFHRLREVLTRALGRPVILVFGPRAMDHYAYLSRPEGALSICVVVTADSEIDLRVPGAHYSFAQLHLALALGEFESLSNAGRFAVRLHLPAHSPEVLLGLEHLFEQALRGKRA
jgi:transaldolase/glucose-6-phosphate isomerase